MGWAVANYDYAANQPNQLSLERGDRVAIINKAGESRGWWKGQIHGRVGVRLFVRLLACKQVENAQVKRSKVCLRTIYLAAEFYFVAVYLFFMLMLDFAKH